MLIHTGGAFMLVWIGKRESDIYFSKYLFERSITYIGGNENGNTSLYITNPNIAYGSDEYLNLLTNEMLELISENKTTKFLFYNSAQAKQIMQKLPLLTPHICGCNTINYDWLRQKTLFRLWASNYCSIPPSVLLGKSQCEFSNLHSLFPGYSGYVIQENLSSGGEKTYLFTDSEITANALPLEVGQTYLVSPYLEGWHSYNAHVLISSHDVLVLSVSLQLIQHLNHKLLYRGGDYSSLVINKHVKEAIINASKDLSQILQSNGYRGILGLDYISDGNDVYVLEANPRFQGSSILLDRELNRSLSVSLYEMHLRCFQNEHIVDLIQSPINCTGSCVYLNDNVFPISIKNIETTVIESQNAKVHLYDRSIYDLILNQT